jgi:ketosteroid isomerase-like protein
VGIPPEIVRRVYDAVEAGDADTVLGAYDRDVVWDFQRSPFGSVLQHRVYHGHDGLRQFNHDKSERRIELSATVSDAVADCLENEKAPLSEGLSVTVRDIAGARYVSPSDPRIVEQLNVTA